MNLRYTRMGKEGVLSRRADRPVESVENASPRAAGKALVSAETSFSSLREVKRYYTNSKKIRVGDDPCLLYQVTGKVYGSS